MSSEEEMKLRHECIKQIEDNIRMMQKHKETLQPIRDVTRRWKSKERLFRSCDDDFMDDMEKAIMETLKRADK